MRLDYVSDGIRACAVPGQQIRIVCPYCRGGTSGERSMTVTATGSLVSWRCFRASCGAYGGDKGAAVGRMAGPRVRPFTLPTRSLDPRQYRELGQTYQLRGIYDWRYCDATDRFIIPIKSPIGRLRGVVARSFSGQRPKTITYPARSDEPLVGWVLPEVVKYPVVVVVEDLISATRVAQAGGTGVALLGTHMSQDACMEIADMSTHKQAVLALDRDAFSNAILIAGRYRALFWPPLRVARLTKDLKDEPETAVEEFLDDHANEREPATEGNDK